MSIPRVVISAPSSGHGKTAVSVGLIAALRARGVATCGFKIGPDHIDAAYLGLAAAGVGRNLDPRLTGVNQLGPLFRHGAGGSDVAVLEGTMGLYDGLAGRTDVESTAQVAGLLRAPVLLVVDVAAMGQSVAALVHGFRAYDELLWLGGVILNRVISDRHEQVLRESLDDVGVPVLGAVRRRSLTAVLPPRAAGVVPALHGSVDARQAVRRLGEAVADGVDLDRVLALARSAPALTAEPWSPRAALAAAQVRAGDRSASADDQPIREVEGPVRAVAVPGRSDARRLPWAGPRPAAVVEDPSEERTADLRGGPVIAVAGTPGGSYGYAEVVELLAAAGAQPVPVDPLRDDRLPAGTRGLVLGGAIPEAYLDEISANVTLLAAIRTLAAAGHPIVAEGAGLILLAREVDGRPMAGVLPTAVHLGGHIIHGYRDAVTQSVSSLLQPGTRLVGHRSHRAACVPRAGVAPAYGWRGGAPEGFVQGNIFASLLCPHWVAVPSLASALVVAARGQASLRAAS